MVLADHTSQARARVPATSDAWTLLAAVVGGILVIAAARPLGDPDVWWHVRTGQLILDSGIPGEETWSFTADGRPWVLTAWLSDVSLAVIHDVAGWRGLVVVKVLLSAALLLLVARQLFRLAPGRIAAPVFALTAIVLSPFMSERPQLVSLLLAAWLVGLVLRVLAGQQPPWWTIAVGYAWASLHGLWVLLPAAMLVCAAGVALDRRPDRRRVIVRCMAVAGATVGAAALTPVGPRLAYWPFVVRDAAATVSEWQPTVLTDRYAVFFLALFLCWVVSVALFRASVPTSEVIWVLSVFLFSLPAGRNVAPAAILLAPFACRALERTFGAALAHREGPRLPAPLSAAVAGSALVIAIILAVARAPLVDGLPHDIVAELETRPAPVRVLNSYGVGGYLTGMAAPHVSVAIDGRTDVYDAAFVRDYMLRTSTTAGWRGLVAELDPDVAVLGERSRLARELVDAGWAPTMTDGDYVLLDRPESVG